MRFFKKKQPLEKCDVPSKKRDIPSDRINTLGAYLDGEAEKDAVIIALDDAHFLKKHREISDALREALDKSTLVFAVADAFMHYMQDGLKEDMNDEGYKNQAVYFWEAKELFPKKSLPPHFEDFPKKYFRTIDECEVACGEVAPWFGQPGGGTKYFFAKDDAMMTIAEAEASNIIEYFSFVDLTEDNADILTDRENCYFLNDGKSLDFIEGWPAAGGKHIPLSVAYECGLFDIVQTQKA
jgi:hypothetical protein